MNHAVDGSEGAKPWIRALERVLDTGDGFEIVFQPIVDLQRGVSAGYEALSRFDGSAEGIPPSPPNVWFEAAASVGLLPALEAVTLQRALDARERLPDNTFLTLNVSPRSFGSDEVDRVLFGQGDLRRVVIEITEEALESDCVAFMRMIRRLRERGALIAADDAGAGYASLSRVLEIRPEFVKIDRAIVDGVSGDEAKLALVEMFGQFAGRIDAWIIAEGVESEGDILALKRLGVPLVQGFGLARPGPEWVGVDERAVAAIRRLVGEGDARTRCGFLIEPWPTVTEGAEAEGIRAMQDGGDPSVAAYGYIPRLSAEQQPLGMIAIEDLARSWPATLVKPTTSVVDAAQRAMTRDLPSRFDPLVVVDESGRYLGVVRIERLIATLSAADAPPPAFGGVAQAAGS